ncbi:MAG: CcmD family protein [Sphingobacteriaceae bacterium]
MKKLLSTSLAMICFLSVSLAQTTPEVEMADRLRASGMIYVVVAVVSILFIGLLIYLFGIDRRITKIENQK